MSNGTNDRDHMQQRALHLWETSPAEKFADAHLLGNGRLGAAVFGAAPDERIAINEDTLWSGSECRFVNEKVRMLLPEVRRLIFERRFAEANTMVNEQMLGIWMQAYQPLANLHLCAHHGPHTGSEYMRRAHGILREGYRRSLDLDQAVETVSFIEDGRRYTREFFVSAPDQVLVTRLAVDAGTMDFFITMTSELRHECATHEDTLTLRGRAPDHVEPDYSSTQPSLMYLPDEESKSVRFAAAVRILATDGAVSAKKGALSVGGASFAVILVAAHTDYAGYEREREADLSRVTERCLQTIAAADRPYEELLKRHLDDHQSLFRRVAVEIGPAASSDLPTTERMKLQSGSVEDPSFAALALQYTRYLLIASSRPGTQAANLQGIWNHLIRPPWSSNYTTNINVQMNYWGAEVLNLAECHGPMIDLILESADSGRRTAREWYGLDGWVAHHNIDLWRSTWPVSGLSTWAWWPMAAGWFCQHLWEHYKYGAGRAFLADTAYPIIEDAARFLLGFLVEDEEGYLSTAPSTSPENSFFVDDQAARKAEQIQATPPGNRAAMHGLTSAVCKSPTMDLTIIREVFAHCIEAADILGRRTEFHDRLERAVERIYPFKIGRHGQLQEWCFDFAECTPGMGHVSHMYGLHPGNLFTKRRNPELYEACRKSMLRRHTHGAFGSGWPGAWAISLFARLKESAICGLIAKGVYKHLGANLMTSTHLQLDCAYGLGAGIAEMLVQSHDGLIELLPALPPSWTEGRIAGLRARGGFEVSIAWRNGGITGAEVWSTAGATCRISAPGLCGVERCGAAIPSVEVEPGVRAFDAEAGGRYTLVFGRPNGKPFLDVAAGAIP